MTGVRDNGATAKYVELSYNRVKAVLDGVEAKHWVELVRFEPDKSAD